MQTYCADLPHIHLLCCNAIYTQYKIPYFSFKFSVIMAFYSMEFKKDVFYLPIRFKYICLTTKAQHRKHFLFPLTFSSANAFCRHVRMYV